MNIFNSIVIPCSCSFFRVVGLPNRFKQYDLNKDGYISMVELADITDTVLEDNEKPFKKADKNGT